MKTMNDEPDKLGAVVKRALETEANSLRLAPHIRRTVIATAEEDLHVAGWTWVLNHKRVLAGAASALVALGMILNAIREEAPHRPEPYLQMSSEVRGGQRDAYWKKKSVEVRTRNGREGHIKVEASWPKRRSIITVNTRR